MTAKMRGAQAPSAAVARRMALEKDVGPSKDKLEKLKEYARGARDLLLRITRGTALLEELNGEYKTVTMETLPDYMDQIRVPSITIDREIVGKDKKGKPIWAPKFEVENKPYYHASIGADWPEEKRADTFEYMREIGHDDLIRTVVSYSFPRGVTMRQIDQFCKLAGKIAIGNGKNRIEIPSPEIARTIPWASLTSWLKGQVEREHFLPKLDKIGGYVGKRARPVFIEEEGDR